MTKEPATLETIYQMLQEVLEQLRAIRQSMRECIEISDRIIATHGEKRELGRRRD